MGGKKDRVDPWASNRVRAKREQLSAFVQNQGEEKANIDSQERGEQEVGNKGRPRDKAGIPKEDQELEEHPARLRQEKEAMRAGPADYWHRDGEELMEDSGDTEGVQLIGRGDKEAGRANQRASSRARLEGEQLAALVQIQCLEAAR